MDFVKKENEYTFIVFSDDWGRHPSSCQHLFKRISKRYKTVWVNTMGMRLPRLSIADLKRIFEKFLDWIAHEKKSNGLKLIVYNPVILPFINLQFVRWLNKRIIISGLRKKKLDKPILVTTIPNAVDVIGHLGESKVVYYRVDDFTKWPGLMHGVIQEMEEELIDKADIIIAPSNRLLGNKKGYILTHGVDLEHFSQKIVNPKLSGIPKPIIGFYGLLDERIDENLLLYVALQRPLWSILLVGKRVVPFKRTKNIYFFNEVDYQELPTYIAGFNVCILPYRVSECTISISPLKLKEYLASGKPVVSVDIPGINDFRNAIYVAKDKQEFLNLVEQALKLDTEEMANWRRNLVMNESWEIKAEQMLKYMGVQ